MTHPKISIITPSYNQGQYLEETIQSVIGQNYPNTEYILIDGGSSDDSPSIIKKYANSFAYWQSAPDNGQVDAISQGFSRSTGEILGWLNSDDVFLHPNVLSQVADLFAQNPKADITTGTGVIMNGQGAWNRQTAFQPQYVSYSTLRYRNTILQPATFFRRNIWETHPLDHALHFAFDWDFWIRITKNNNLLATPNVWAGARWWGENKTASGNPRRTWEQAEVFRRYSSARTWQYIALRSFYASYRLIESVPHAFHAPGKKIIRLLSLGLARLSRDRIPTT
jgi:glycosyltransferase involved in cell wall biosynthesis